MVSYLLMYRPHDQPCYASGAVSLLLQDIYENKTGMDSVLEKNG